MKTKDLKVVINIDNQEIRYKGITEFCSRNYVDIPGGYKCEGYTMDNIIFDKMYLLKEYFKNKIDNQNNN